MVTPRFLPDLGGTEIHTHETAKRLQRLGACVTVVTTASASPSGQGESDSAVPVIKVRAWPRWLDLYFAPGLGRALRGSRPDLVHIQGFHTLFAPLAMLVSRRMATPYVVSFHSGGHSSHLRTILRPVQAALLRPLLSRAEALVTGSRFETDLFSRWLRLPPESFVVLPSGVDLPHPPEPSPERPEERLIVSVGRLESYKRHQTVLRALPELHRLRPEVRLRIAGRGRYEPQLRRLARRLGVAHLVEISPVPAGRREDMARLLARADVVVSLSAYESQGIAMQEALALGRPLVVSDGGALAELAVHDNVAVVPARGHPHAIAAAIASMLDAGQAEPPATPTWDACAAGLMEIYEGALSKARA